MTEHDAQNVPLSVPKRAHATKPAACPRGITVYRRKLAHGESETYYCRFRVRGKDGITRQPQLDTGCAELRAAIKWATAQRDALASGQKNQVLAARLSQDRPGVPTVGTLLRAWEHHQHRANDRTAGMTLSGFRLVWREALDAPDNAALDAMSCAALTKPALMAWIAGRQALDRPNFRDALPANNTIRARLREVRSVLSPRHAHLWAEAGLVVPDFGALLDIPMPEGTATPFSMLSPDEMEAIEKAIDSSTDRNMVRGFWLMRLLAMRNSEVAACRVGWAETMGGKRFIRICHRPEESFTLKRRENVRYLELPERLAPWFEGDASQYILAGSETERTSSVWRRLNVILRPFLPGREKAAYELRKQRISEEMVDTGSIVAAAALAGDLVATIERHYCDIAANMPALRMQRAKVIDGGQASA